MLLLKIMKTEQIYSNFHVMDSTSILTEYFRCLLSLSTWKYSSGDYYSYAISELRYKCPFIFELDETGHKLAGNVAAIYDLENRVWEFLESNDIKCIKDLDKTMLTLFKLQVLK